MTRDNFDSGQGAERLRRPPLPSMLGDRERSQAASKAKGVGAKVVGNEREGRAKGGAGRRQRKSAGLARGVGWVGARVNTGHLAAQPTRPLVCVWFVQLSLGGGGAEVVATGERGVGWVGARVDAGLLAAQPTGPGPLVYDGICVVAVGRRLSHLGLIRSLGGRCETGEGGGWGHGWARAGGAVREGTPKKGSQKSARAVSSS
ncbi:hypothetical protein THAOC_28738 [Thalassiosira oceanica]|uniref:Uncharacterized protein n=1 Tax=Thalassiosira oceanica TaxID=159749 RepID=K0RIC6_THAOC|nr:hypothetical protein THAOC_28738 [Thalassiosira oceanica]|eukprot:EJK52034.1 hypothetical protein THAOC_28738 [Thalassiosira oceanica]